MSIGMRHLAKTTPNAQYQVLAVVFACMYLLTLPVVLYLGDVYLAALTQYWPWLLAAGIALTLNPLCFYVALRHLDAAMATLLATTNILVAIFGAIWLLDERLLPQQFIGSAIVIGAIVYSMSVKLTKRERRKWLWGAGFTLLSGIFLAISMIIQKYLLGHMSGQSFVVWGWGIQTLLAVLLSLAIGRHMYKVVFRRRSLPHLAGAGLAKAGAAGGFVASLVIFRSLSLAIVLAGLRPLFVSILGWLMLGEHHFLRRKIIASLLAGAGVGLMFWH
jgi:drug/metabolite transporter (DMT)-like permease